jgi:hypothetical protein
MPRNSFHNFLWSLLHWKHLAPALIIGMIIYIFKPTLHDFIGTTEELSFLEPLLHPAGIAVCSVILLLVLAIISAIAPRTFDALVASRLLRMRQVDSETLRRLDHLYTTREENVRYGDKIVDITGPLSVVHAVDKSHPGDWWSNGIMVYDAHVSLWSRRRMIENAVEYVADNSLKTEDIIIDKTDQYNIILIVKSNPSQPVKLDGRIERLFVWKKRYFKSAVGANIIASQHKRGNFVLLLTENEAKTIATREAKNYEAHKDNSVIMTEFVIWDIDTDNPHLPRPAYACYISDEKSISKLCLGYRAIKKNEMKKIIGRKKVGITRIREEEKDKYWKAWNSLKAAAITIEEIENYFDGSGLNLSEMIRKYPFI